MNCKKNSVFTKELVLRDQNFQNFVVFDSI